MSPLNRRRVLLESQNDKTDVHITKKAEKYFQDLQQNATKILISAIMISTT